MAFWAHLRNKRIFSNTFNLVRRYSRLSMVVTQADSRQISTSMLERSSLFDYQFHSRDIGARFYSVKGKAKQTVADPKVPRLNAAITANAVRLVTDDGHCILSRQEALNRAARLQLDLVEVSRFSDPPVCKIMDYNKEKYDQKSKGKDRLKRKPEITLRSEVKEVRFSMKIEQKDLQLKASTALRLMERGYKVKCMAMGKEEENLGDLLSRLTTLLADVTYIETGPRLEKTHASAVLRHVKFGLPRKSGKKSVTTGVAENNEGEEVMDEDGVALQEQDAADGTTSDFEDANLVGDKEKLDKPPKTLLNHQHKPVLRPTERDGRSDDNQPRKIIENPSATNTKHLHPPAADKSSDTKQGAKSSSFGIFSSSKAVDTNNQQSQNSKNGRGEAGLLDSKIDAPNEKDNGHDPRGKFSKQSPGPNQQGTSSQYPDRYQQRPSPQTPDRYQLRPSPRTSGPYQQRPGPQSQNRYQQGPGPQSPGPYQQKPGPQTPGPYQQRPPQAPDRCQQGPSPHNFRR